MTSKYERRVVGQIMERSGGGEEVGIKPESLKVDKL